jgi:hypothetical protein
MARNDSLLDKTDLKQFNDLRKIHITNTINKLLENRLLSP